MRRPIGGERRSLLPPCVFWTNTPIGPMMGSGPLGPKINNRPGPVLGGRSPPPSSVFTHLDREAACESVARSSLN